MTLGTKIIPSLMTRLTRFILSVGICYSLEHLMQFREVIHIILQFVDGVIRRGMDFDLDDVTGLISDIDLALTTIANVVDHQ